MTGTPSAVAGRLEVLVEASLTGFRKKLQAQVEAAAKGVDAKVGVELEDGAGATLKAKVKALAAEAAGEKVTIDVEIDENRAKTQLQGFLKRVTSKMKPIKVKTEFDTNGDVDVPVRGTDRLVTDVKAAWARAKAAAKSWSVTIPIRAAIDRAGSGGGGGLLDSLLSGEKPDGRFRGFGLAILYALGSAIQPVVGTLGAAVGGLAAAVGAMAPALNTVVAAVPGIAALGQGFIAGAVAAKGMGAAITGLLQQEKALDGGTKMTAAQQKKLDDALKGLTPSAKSVVKEVVGLHGAWTRLQKSTQEALFSRIVGDIKPLASRFLPTLQRGLKETAGVLGDLGHETLVWVNSPLFNGQFARIGKTNNVLLAAMGSWLLDGAKSMTAFLDAARPFTTDLAASIERAGAAMREFFEARAADGGIAAWLETSSERASLLWHTLKQLGAGIHGVFKAGDATGLDMLKRFDKFVTRWQEFVNSDDGQAKIAAWFEDVEPVATEVAGIIKDIAVGLADWADDPKLLGLVKTLRNDMLPALSDILETMADSSAESFTHLFSELIETLQQIGPSMFGVLGEFTEVLASIVEAINWVIDVVPGGAEALGLLLGTLAGFHTVRAIGGALAGVVTGLRTLGPTLGPIAAFVSGLLVLGGAFESAREAGTQFTSWLAGAAGGALIGGAVGSIVPGVGTLIGALIGAGVGGGGTALVDAFGKTKESAKQLDRYLGDAGAVEARKSAIDQLTASLEKATGKTTEFTREQLLSDIQNNKVNPSSRKGMAALTSAGISPKDITSAMLGVPDAVARVNAALDSFQSKLDSNRTTISTNKDQINELRAAMDAPGSTSYLGTDAELKAKIEDLRTANSTLESQNDSLEAGLNLMADGNSIVGEAKEGWRKAKVGLQGYIGDISKLPDALERAVKNKGLIGYDINPNAAYAEVQNFAKKFDLSRPEVKVLMRAEGMDTTKAEVDAMMDSINRSTDAKQPKVKPEVDTTASGKAKTAATKFAQGIAAGLAKNKPKVTLGGDVSKGVTVPVKPKIDRKASATVKGQLPKIIGGGRAGGFGTGVTVPVKPKVETKGTGVKGALSGVIASLRKAAAGAKIKVAPKVEVAGAQTAAKRFTGVVRSIKSSASGLTGQLSAAAKKAMAGFAGGMKSNAPASSARSSAERARSAASGVSFSSAGANMAAGLAAGISSGAGGAIAAAASMASRALAAAKSVLDIHSPSRAFAKLGRFSVSGYIAGLKLEGKKLKRIVAATFARPLKFTQDALNKALGSAFSGKRIRAGFKAIDQFSRRLKALGAPLHAQLKADKAAMKSAEKRSRHAKKNDQKAASAAYQAAKKRYEQTAALQKKLYSAATGQVEKWRQKLADLRSEQAEFRQTIRDGFKDFGSIGSVASSMGGYANPAALITSLTQRAKQAKDYVTNLAKLRGRGLSDTLYRQLIELGVEEGGPIVAQLMSATRDQLKKISSLQGQINSYGGSLAKTAGSALYDASIKAADAFVDRLKKRATELAILLGYKKAPKSKKPKGQKHADGGPVRGPGTSTSDSILAWLSNGEFVVKAAAVARYGLGFLQAINAGRFAKGGLAGKKSRAQSTMLTLTKPRPKTRPDDGPRKPGDGPLVEKVEQNFYDTGKNAGDELVRGLRKIKLGGLHGATP